jgi:hypothetical protein
MEVIETSKGKPSQLYDGHAYRKYRTNEDGAVTWVCLKEECKACKGELVSKNNEVLRPPIRENDIEFRGKKKEVLY